MATKNQYSSADHSDADDNYSDDFIQYDEHDRSGKPKQSPARGRGRSKGRGRGRGSRRGAGGGSQSRAASDSGLDAVAKRLLSASHHKTKELQNELEDLRRQMKITSEENKLYRRLQHKQEKALEKFEDREGELPQLIQAHNNEVRTLKEQLRRMREKYDKTDRYLRDAEDELEKVKTRLKKYKDLADQQELGERSELKNKLMKAELQIEEKESKVKELERYMDILKKNHRHELGIERARSKDSQRQLEQAQDVNKKLEEQIKEKEKLLELRNIYSNRLQPSSYGGTPHTSPPLWKQAVKKRAPSLTDLTPRDKAKAYEEKRRVEDRKKKAKVVKQQKWEEEARREHVGSKENQTSFNGLPHQDSEDDFWKRQEEEYKQQRDQESGEKEREQEEAERKKEERDREQFRRQRDKMKQDLEEREKAERLRREEDEKERRERERAKKEREEREQREQAERERKEQEQWERERRGKENQERRAREERERLDNDPKLAEERRKKDELLRRLKQLDDNPGSSLPQDPFSPAHADKAKTAHGGGDTGADTRFTMSSNNFVEKKQQKDSFLVTRADSSDSTPSSKRDYAFTRPIENLHKGKPSHEDVSVPYLERQRRSRAEKEDLEIGGYQPSFSGAGKSESGKMQKPKSMFEDDESSKMSPAQMDKKSKLMADLFGPQAAVSQSKKNNSGEFFLTNKNPPPQQVHSKPSSGFPWDDDKTSSRAGGTSTVSRRESSVLFGGGAALVDDDSPTNSSSAVLLPRQQRHPPTTFSSKPAVTAVDNLDDDIEEVIL